MLKQKESIKNMSERFPSGPNPFAPDARADKSKSVYEDHAWDQAVDSGVVSLAAHERNPIQMLDNFGQSTEPNPLAATEVVDVAPRRSLGENPNEVFAAPQRAYGADRLAARGEQVVSELKSKAKNGIGNMLNSLKAAGGEMKSDFVADARAVRQGATEAAYAGIGLAAETADKFTGAVSKTPGMMKDTAKNLFDRGRGFIQQVSADRKEKAAQRQQRRAENAMAREQRKQARMAKAESVNQTDETEGSSVASNENLSSLQRQDAKSMELANKLVEKRKQELAELKRKAEEASDELNKARREYRKFTDSNASSPEAKRRQADVLMAEAKMEDIQLKMSSASEVIVDINKASQEAANRIYARNIQAMARKAERQQMRAEARRDFVESAKDRVGKLIGEDTPNALRKVGKLFSQGATKVSRGMLRARAAMEAAKDGWQADIDKPNETNQTEQVLAA